MIGGVNKKSIRDQVLEAIENGRVKMRPKWHFILKSALLITGTIILVLTLLYLASFIIFVLRQTGILFVPIFGSGGWRVFFSSLPWFLLLLLLVFIVILEALIRRYSFAYRRPLVYSAAGIVLAIIIGGYAVAETSLHGRMFKNAEKGRLPIAGRLYRKYGLMRFQNIHLGTITETTDNGFVIQNRRGETLRVIITPETRFPLGTDFARNDTVVVLGKRNDGEIRAIGIRKVSDEFGREQVLRKEDERKPFGPPVFRGSSR